MPEPDLSQMMTVFLVFLRKGPNYTAEETPEVLQLHQAHLAHLASLRRSGQAIAVGPILEPGDVRGVSILRVPSADEARSLAEADPAVRAGRFLVEVHPWMVERAALGERS